jgi:serine protease Do
MSTVTNSLVGRMKRWMISAGGAAAVFGIALFLSGHNIARAASGAAQAENSASAPLNASSIAPLVTLNNAIEAVAAHVTPAVVSVSVTSRVSGDDGNGNQENGQNGGQNFGIPPQDLPPGFQRFFFGPGGGQNMQPQPQIEHGVGSGVILSPDGYIVTNYHVVNGATQIQVTLHDRRIFHAKLIGVDKLNDLAVVKIDAHNLPAASWGDSTKLAPGETVLAFGSPFGYFHFSVTHGIVSALNRPNPYASNRRTPGDFIQTDAAINPGNSGGPLVNAYGQVIGINTFIISNSGSFAGAGFAIPSEIAEASVNALIKNGVVHHGYLGISMEDVTPENASFFNLPDASGAIVSQVTPSSPADEAGMKNGDVLRELEGKKIADGSALQVAVSEMAPGAAIHVGILRNGKPETLKVTVGEFHEGNSEEAENNGAGPLQHTRLGLAVTDLTPDVRQQLNIPPDIHGVAIQNVRPGSPADDAGLAQGEVILQVNRRPVENTENFVSEIHALPPDQNVLFLVWSKQGTVYLVVHPEQNDKNEN